jgi:hypothetical protein
MVAAAPGLSLMSVGCHEASDVQLDVHITFAHRSTRRVALTSDVHSVHLTGRNQSPPLDWTRQD